MDKLLFTAFDQGITHFDLANNYGPAPGSAVFNLTVPSPILFSTKIEKISKLHAQI